MNKDSPNLSSPNLDQPNGGVSCDVVAWGVCLASAADLPSLRKSPGTLGFEPLPNGLLRHVDEQTVVGVAAVLRAVGESGLDPSSFGRWSVLAAPRFLGRAKFEASFSQYLVEEAWGVSPHLVPGHSLHSPSGTISQVLHAHGPNLGIGGTAGGEREAFLVAATWLDAGWADGVWMVLTSRDPAPTGEAVVSEPGSYRALALALVPAGSRPESDVPRLHIGPRTIDLESSSVDRSARTELLDWLKPAGGPVGSGTIWRADAGHAPGPSRHAHSSPARLRSDRATRIRESI
jgi:hypothetical protein